MKVEIPQINWHGGKPILTVDFHPFSNFFVTCGLDEADSNMRIIFWELVKQEDIIRENGGKETKDATSQLEWVPVFKYAETGLPKQPNLAKFSPKGTYLASAGGDESVSLWMEKMRFIEIGKSDKELRWGIMRTIKTHFGEISDF